MLISNSTRDIFRIGIVPFVPQFSPCFVRHIAAPTSPMTASCTRNSGTHVQIIYHILQYLNATAEYHIYRGHGRLNANGNATGMLGGFQRGEIDWTGPLWGQTEERAKYVTFATVPGDKYRTCFIIHPVENIKIINPLATLPIVFWPLIIAAQLSMAYLLWRKSSRHDSIFHTMFIISFEQKNKLKFSTFFSRLIISIWCPSAWILLITFKGKYVAQFARSVALPADFTDLPNFIGDYQILLFENVVLTNTVLTSTSYEMQAIQRKLTSTPAVMRGRLPTFIEYLLKNRGLIALAYDAFAVQTVLKYPDLQLTCNDALNVYGHVAMRKGLSGCVGRKLNKISTRIVEFGVDSYIRNRYARPIVQSRGDAQPLKVKSALSVLILLATGLVVATLVVVVEVWNYGIHRTV